MDPVSWGLITTSLIGAGATIAQGAAARRTENYNAKVLEGQAVQARKLGELEREREVRLGARRAASIQTTAAGAGLSLTGSVQDVYSDQIAEASRNAAMAMMRSSYSAELFEAQAGTRRMRGEDAFTGGLISGASTLSAGAFAASGGFRASRPSGSSGGVIARAPSGQSRGFSGGRFGGGV